MFPDDPKVIKTLADLKEVAQQMKVSASPDDKPESYTKTEEDAKKVRTLEVVPKEVKKYLLNDGSNRAIVLNGHFLSLVLSTDEYNGYQWHLSVCEFANQKGQKPSSELTGILLPCFFSKWKFIANPGRLQEIIHFVGND